jgi:hypothetical protein
LVLLSAPRSRTYTPDEALVAWAEMHVADAMGDILALKTSTRVWYHRKDHDPVDITAIEVARLERRVRLLTRLIERKQRAIGVASEAVPALEAAPEDAALDSRLSA